jgi:predicted aminopeptidase
VNISSWELRIRTPLAVLAVTPLLGACYLLQTASGQMDVMNRRQPITTVIAKPATPAKLRTQLARVADIRHFASAELGLPHNGSYTSYADVERPYVVWNVFAAPEFSVLPKLWCFPIVGCVAYRGYFKESRARTFADRLRRKGYDVAMGGVAAYSTLGHFDDPILNTMLGWGDTELASIIFHELTHQLLYVKSDADFNEALATAVEEEGVRRWLLAQGRENDLADYQARRQRFLGATALLLGARDELTQLYGQQLPRDAMRSAKQQVLRKLSERYAALKQQWTGRGAFDDWFAAGINNAHLVSVATYYRCVPGFERELAAVQGDLGAFYARARELAKLKAAERREMLCTP